MLPINQSIKMTSADIADLVNTRHDTVKRSIDRMANSEIIKQPPMADVTKETQTGLRNTKVYVFEGEQGKRDSIIVVAQLSPEFTARLVDRWQELENLQSGKVALPDFGNPAVAARAWADQYEKNKLLALQAEENKPKVEFYDAVTGSSHTTDMGRVAKTLNYAGFGRNRLFAFLREQGVLQKDNLPYQKYVDNGWFRVIESSYTKPTGEKAINFKTVVYQRGMDGIRRMLEKQAVTA